MTGMWWPLGSKLVCAAQSPRSRIHAAFIMDALVDLKAGRLVVRTVCGLDAFPYSVTCVDGHGVDRGLMVAPWPAPAVERCTDCATLTKIGGKQRAGSRMFQQAVPAQ